MCYQRAETAISSRNNERGRLDALSDTTTYRHLQPSDQGNSNPASNARLSSLSRGTHEDERMHRQLRAVCRWLGQTSKSYGGGSVWFQSTSMDGMEVASQWLATNQIDVPRGILQRSTWKRALACRRAQVGRLLGNTHPLLRLLHSKLEVCSPLASKLRVAESGRSRRLLICGGKAVGEAIQPPYLRDHWVLRKNMHI